VLPPFRREVELDPHRDRDGGRDLTGVDTDGGIQQAGAQVQPGGVGGHTGRPCGHGGGLVHGRPVADKNAAHPDRGEHRHSGMPAATPPRRRERVPLALVLLAWG
jgi:hypothetical protein